MIWVRVYDLRLRFLVRVKDLKLMIFDKNNFKCHHLQNQNAIYNLICLPKTLLQPLKSLQKSYYHNFVGSRFRRQQRVRHLFRIGPAPPATAAARAQPEPQRAEHVIRILKTNSGVWRLILLE